MNSQRTSRFRQGTGGRNRRGSAFPQPFVIHRTRHRRQHESYQQHADREGGGGDQEHHGKAVVQRQRKRQRRADHPCQRKLGAHHRAEHHDFTRLAVGVFPRQREDLRHGGVGDRRHQHPGGDQRQVVAVKSEQQAVADRHQAAQQDQPAPVAAGVRTFGEQKTDHDAGHGVGGVKQADPQRPHLDLGGQKQAERRRQQRAGNAGEKSDQQECGKDGIDAQ